MKEQEASDSLVFSPLMRCVTKMTNWSELFILIPNQSEIELIDKFPTALFLHCNA